MSGGERHWVQVNRAPVLTLWAAVVARRLGFRKDEALTLGRAVAGLNAQSKGRRLGIFEPTKGAAKEARRKARASTVKVELLGRAVPCRERDGSLRALSKDEPIDPETVTAYLEKKFGEALDDVEEAFQHLARSRAPKELADSAYDLYEDFRPDVPAGRKGWGAEGRLSLDHVRTLADETDES